MPINTTPPQTLRMQQQLMCKTPHNQQSGVGLVEVLVALVVMSVGMLGIASLYVTTLQAKTTSLSRMKAVNLANDIADRIRANPAGIDKVAGTNNYLLAESATTTATDCMSAICTPAQVAAADLDEWDAMIVDNANGTGLPGGANLKRSIVRTAAATATTPEIITITLTWREAATTTADLTYALQVQI
jgi:type IV pilus assembly protein PilV